MNLRELPVDTKVLPHALIFLKNYFRCLFRSLFNFTIPCSRKCLLLEA